jgi:hypothetical protein
MHRLALSIAIGAWSAHASAGDAPFCSCDFSGVCHDPSDPTQPACIGFDEAADLARQPGSGVYQIATRVDPAAWGAVDAAPANANAICQRGTCYVRGDGQVSLTAYGHQSVFFGWSGCSDATQPHLVLGPIIASTECIAQMGPGLIVVHTSVTGRSDAKVQIAGSCSGEGSCSFLNGGSVTLTAPPSTERYAFLGWSGCSSSTEPRLTFTNVRQPLPACVAQYTTVVY